MKQQYDCSYLTNEALIQKLKQLGGEERKAKAAFLVHLSEVDHRKLYAELGYSSLFKYCLEDLHLSEGSTCRRIQAARTARQYPVIYTLIEEGKIHLEAVSLLSPLLNEGNHQELLEKVYWKTKREVEEIVAGLAPKKETLDFIRNLPQKRESTFAGECKLDVIVPEPRKEETKPISEERVVFKFTGSRELRKKLERAKEILRHKYPEGKLEDIFNEALETLLEKKDPEIRITVKKKQHQPIRKAEVVSSRRIPRSIKDTVWKRDGGRCAYTTHDGKRCAEKGWLEFDHIQPWALGGLSDDVRNVRLLCRAHNQLSGSKIFGKLHRADA